MYIFISGEFKNFEGREVNFIGGSNLTVYRDGVIGIIIRDFKKVTKIGDKDNKINSFIFDGIKESEDEIIVGVGEDGREEGLFRSGVDGRRDGDVNMEESLRVFEL